MSVKKAASLKRRKASTTNSVKTASWIHRLRNRRLPVLELAQQCMAYGRLQKCNLRISLCRLSTKSFLKHPASVTVRTTTGHVQSSSVHLLAEGYTELFTTPSQWKRFSPTSLD